MSFEEKYNKYSNRKHVVSEDYVNKTVNKVSEKIAERRGLKIPIGWSLSGVSFAAAALILGLFVYPKFMDHNGDTPIAKNPTDSINNMAINEEVPRNSVLNMDEFTTKNDSGSLAVEQKKQNEKENIETAEVDKETIMEYLLDEGYEEI